MRIHCVVINMAWTLLIRAFPQRLSSNQVQQVSCTKSGLGNTIITILSGPATGGHAQETMRVHPSIVTADGHTWNAMPMCVPNLMTSDSWMEVVDPCWETMEFPPCFLLGHSMSFDRADVFQSADHGPLIVFNFWTMLCHVVPCLSFGRFAVSEATPSGVSDDWHLGQRWRNPTLFIRRS